MITFLIITGAYLAGSIPVGYLLCRIVKKIDIRNYGSGNIGATNVYRVAGGKLAIWVLILDILKGLLPVIIVKQVFCFNLYYAITAGVASITGHNFSIFLKGKGGKGVSTAFGVVAGLFPLPAILSLIIWLVIVATTGYVSLGAISASLLLPLFIYILQKDLPSIYTGIIIAILITYAHKSNIKRLIRKEEHKIKLPWKKK